ncbi:hypothetical protein HAP41_0000005880 [Bradyrhizobium barranii subsp. apii]|uniref:Uncharacterized protein n=1 Tax=Bradyrhizobium barranii subsp. apii TaxID=2819348 RepID=A0A8T5VMY4_9BRAD|nr:hypothetical protein [Bradyrhizobium barranii]UPT88611.1 hypothetical protein HAP41_0000005880 [Bradyrhizobium barranii subsp. apii]
MRVKLNRGNLTVSLPFARPLLMQPQLIPPSFFQMVYGALTPDFPIAAAEFSAGAGNKLSEVFARFNLYGGVNTATLYCDRLVFDFANLTPADYPIVYDIMRRIHDAFPNAFDQVGYARTEISSFIHFEVEAPGDANEYLNRFQPTGSLQPFVGVGELVTEPVGRFHLIGVDQTWRCKFGVEKSAALANGIFVDMTIVLSNPGVLPRFSSFVSKLEMASRIGIATRAVLELEWDT